MLCIYTLPQGSGTSARAGVKSERAMAFARGAHNDSKAAVFLLEDRDMMICGCIENRSREWCCPAGLTATMGEE